MAISSSGAVSFANLQNEYGGSNPISLNEYYSGGSLVKANTSSTANSSTIDASTNTVGSGKSSYYEYFRGWAHSSLFASGQPFASFSSPGTQTTSGSIAKISGADLTGNSGAIPSSGTIDMNKFRGTAKGTTSSTTCYAWYTRRVIGIANSNLATLILAGHYGAASEAGGSWTGVPFSYITTAAIGSPQMPATNWGGYTNVSLGGANGGYGVKSHYTFPNIGNVTQFSWTSNGAYDNFSGFWSTTIYF